MEVQVKYSNQLELRITAGCLQLLQCVSFLHRPQYFKNCSRVEPFHGSRDHARSLLQKRLLMGSPVPLDIHLLRHGILHGLLVVLCSTVDSSTSQSPFDSGSHWSSSPSSMAAQEHSSALATPQPRHFAMAVSKVFPGTTH